MKRKTKKLIAELAIIVLTAIVIAMLLIAETGITPMRVENVLVFALLVTLIVAWIWEGRDN